MPDSPVRVDQAAARGIFSALQLVSKRKYQGPTGCQGNFETLLYFEEAIMSGRETAELLLLVGRLVQANGYDGELSPAQWMALRFFARANSFSRTPSAFAEFQATTRGTASQAIKALEAGGYLVRQRSQADGRSVTLRLTDKGHEAVARDPFEVLVRAVDSLNAQEQTAMRDALHHVLTTIAASGAHQHFGVCQDCAYLGGETYCDSTRASQSALGCLLFGVPMEPHDASLLCVHFQPKSERREDGHRE
jgi:DNA-binding MarR family transcriptional regulator